MSDETKPDGDAQQRRSTIDKSTLNGHRLLSGHEWKVIAASLNLSPRELQIVQRVFHDENEATIAAELGMAPGTVHTHLERLYRKLNVHTRCALVVRIMVQHRLLGLDRRD